jgi:hypothetical protein
MKNTFWLAAAVCLALLFSFCKTPKKTMTTQIGDPKKGWQLVDSLENQGLPKSALESTEQLLAAARAKNDRAETIKALIYRAKYQTQLDENGLTTAIQNLRKETNAATGAEKAILQSMTAELLTTYLQNQGWQIRNRTDGGAVNLDDISTWSVADFERESQQLYAASISETELLKTIQVADYQALMTENLRDSIDGNPIRPTLLDFLGHRAFCSIKRRLLHRFGRF